jgi:hypothetical protein
MQVEISILDKIAVLKAAIYIVEEQRLKLEDLAKSLNIYESPWSNKFKISKNSIEEAAGDFESTVSVLADVIVILEKEYKAILGYSTINTIDLKSEFNIENTEKMSDEEISELKEKIKSKLSNLPLLIKDVKVNTKTNEAIIWFGQEIPESEPPK